MISHVRFGTSYENARQSRYSYPVPLQILPLRENVKNGKESMIKIFVSRVDAHPPLQSSSLKRRLKTLWFGANDAVLEDRPQHVPIDRYKDNLKFFISQLRSEESPYYSPDTTIIVVTPPPIDEGSRRIDQVRKWGEHCTKDRSWEVTQQYGMSIHLRSLGKKFS